MPQNPLNLSSQTPAGALAPTHLDAVGNLMVSLGGLSTKLNLTAATVIKATAGRIAKIVIVSGGSTSGGFTLNDAATIGAAAASNEIISVPQGTAASTVIDLDWPCANGIVLSAVPGGGSPVLAISYS